MDQNKIQGIFPQITTQRDKGGVLRQVDSQDYLFPEEIHSQTDYNWLGKTQTSSQEYFGLKRETQFSHQEQKVTERINLFGACTIINNYDPATGQYLGSFLELEDD